MTPACWHCGQPLTDLPPRISFREICPHCHAYLHCCMNCQNHEVGRSNECKIPGTDYIADRRNGNYCEELLFLGNAPPPKANPDDILKRLFGD